MAYTAWSVVFGEQPTAAKWNQLGTNDAGFKDGTNFDDDLLIERMFADAEIPFLALGADIGAMEVLGAVDAGASRTMSVTLSASKRFLKVIVFNPYDANSNGIDLRFNSDSGNNYAHNRVLLGTSTDNPSNNSLEVNPNYRGGFSITDIADFSGKVKQTFTVNHSFRTGTASNAADVPASAIYAGKWTSTARITSIQAIRRVNNFVSGARMVVLGRD